MARFGHLRLVIVLALASLTVPSGSAAAIGAQPSTPFAELPGWSEEDHAAALRAFLPTCGRVVSASACSAARRAAASGRAASRRYLEARFEPVEIDTHGFLTGYYEPELAGSLTHQPGFRVPLLERPPGVVDRPPGPPPAGWPEGLSAARRTPEGFEPLPDRAAIEDGALGAAARPLVFLSDPVDAFAAHVQGSARIRLTDGRVLRVGFAGRNGHPYTPIGRVLADAEGVPRSEMTADRLFRWLKDNPDRAVAIMRANRSYIFFRRTPAPAHAGPIGAAGVPLTPGRSLAVDTRHTPLGGLAWLEGEVPDAAGRTEPLRRVVVAQDVGAAILGLGRGDLFVGSGEIAGIKAGRLRHPVRWIALRPKRAAAPARQ